ncbi:MAG: sigma 54-interacting transcriptional regulator [Thermincolia bacterium]
MTVVATLRDKCKACYGCIRNCPVKAIQVEDGQALVVEERCISCGSCVRVCSQKAKTIESDSELVQQWLRETDSQVIAMLAPSFLVSFPMAKPEQMVSALVKAGFAGIDSVATGVDYTLPLYRKHLAENKQPVISSFCPAIVGLIEKHFPRLIPNLAPIDSAMMALAKDLRNKYPQSKLVFLGPCVAKKEEARTRPDIINAVLTFRELKELFAQEGIKPEDANSSGTDFTQTLAQIFPVSGGLLRNLKLDGEDFLTEMSMIEGQSQCLDIISSLEQRKVKPRFLDILFCRGCIDGPEVDSPLDFYARKKLLLNQARLQNPGVPATTEVDLWRGYEDKSRTYSMPSEEEIKKILHYTYKTNPEDELNCCACGYNTCREKAVAVYQGLAEPDMCLPYLLHNSRGELEYYKTRLSGTQGPKYSMDAIVGRGKPMEKLKQLVAMAAQDDSPVLIQGEAGVGKKVLALALHNLGRRRKGAFVSINCGELPELILEAELFGSEEGVFAGQGQEAKQGCLERSVGGTLLLDAVDQLPLNLQSRLFRVLENQEFQRVGGGQNIKLDVGILAATTRDFKELLEEGVFRQDLYGCLSTLKIYLPPLKQRQEDIPQLIDFIIEKLTREKGLAPKIVAQKTVSLLMNYSWPGNIGQLENVLERALYLADGNMIQPEHLPADLLETKKEPHGHKVRPLKEAVRDLEKELIQEALQLTDNNKLTAAKMLGIPRATLYQRLKEFELL